MDFYLLFNLLSNMSLIAMCAYLFGRTRYIIQCAHNPSIFKNWAILTAIFAILSSLCTASGIPTNGALASTRMVGTLMSGILGGPYVGFSVGLISGMHRYLVGGFTAETCAIATVLGGLSAGLVRHKIGLNHLTWKTAALVALAVEVLQKSMVLLFAKPFAAAWALETVIALPTTLVTVLGATIFMLILKDIQVQQELHGAKSAELSLEIASRTLPYLRHGLTAESAQKTAQIIYELTKIDAVSISDRDNVLAFIGKGSDHHQAGQPIITQSTKQAISNNTMIVLNTKEERGCPAADCPLNSAVVAPLIAHSTVVGTIKLSRTDANAVSEIDIRIADGIANLLSGQIELAEIDHQRKMREKAEFKALQAQINPHFLFNTLSIIMSFCRTNPDMARNLLSHLATMLQYSFANHKDFVTLAEEINNIQAFLEIAKSRFGSRLQVNTDIDPSILHTKIPVLSIQPLVENAVQHGLFPKINECVLSIAAKLQQDNVIISVADNGSGMETDKLQQIFTSQSEGIGIRNVYMRLKSIYGDNYGLSIDSQPGDGTIATIRIPYERMNIQHAG